MELSWYYTEENLFAENFKYLRNVGLHIKSTVLFIIKTILQHTLIIGCLLHFITVNKKNAYVSDLLEDCAIILSGISMDYNIFCFRFKSKDIFNLIDHLNDHKIFGKPEKLDKTKKILDTLVKFYYYSMFSAVIFYATYTLFAKEPCNKQVARDGKERVCGLVCQFMYFEGITKSPYNQIVFFFQNIGAFLTIQAAGATFSFIITCCEHVILRIDHLMSMLTELNVKSSDELKRMHFVKCVLYHKTIISLVDEINSCFSGIMFAVITADTVVVGIIMVQCLFEPSIIAFIHLTGWTFTLLVLSISGQRLYDKALLLQVCISGLKVYDMSISLNKDLIFMLLRSQYPLVLKAGDFGIMSLPTYVAAMKTAYSYVAVVQQAL